MNERLWGILTGSFTKILVPGLTVTIPLTIIAFSLAMVIAVVVALIQFANVKILKQICRFYIWIIRGTPLLVQLYVIFFGLPNLGIMIDPFPCAVLVFAINEGAYCAETMRAALESVPNGQIEAGLLRRYELPPDHVENRAAPGTPHRIPAVDELPDWHGEGHLPWQQILP